MSRARCAESASGERRAERSASPGQRSPRATGRDTKQTPPRSTPRTSASRTPAVARGDACGARGLRGPPRGGTGTRRTRSAPTPATSRLLRHAVRHGAGGPARRSTSRAPRPRGPRRSRSAGWPGRPSPDAARPRCAFFDWARRTGRVDSDPAARLASPRVPRTLPTVLAVGTVRRACSTTRARPLLRVGRPVAPVGAGIRVGRVAGSTSTGRGPRAARGPVSGRATRSASCLRAVARGAGGDRWLDAWTARPRAHGALGPRRSCWAASSAGTLGAAAGSARRCTASRRRRASTHVAPHDLRHSAAQLLAGARTCAACRRSSGTPRSRRRSATRTLLLSGCAPRSSRRSRRA